MRVVVLFIIALVLLPTFAEAKTPVEIYVLPFSEVGETSCVLRPSKLHEVVASHHRSTMKSEEGCVLFLKQKTFEYLEVKWRLNDYRYLDTEHRRVTNSSFNFTGRHLVVRSGGETRFCALPTGSPVETYYIDPNNPDQCDDKEPTLDDLYRWGREARPPWEREALERDRTGERGRSSYRRPLRLGDWYD
jgi:hypothetical protein